MLHYFYYLLLKILNVISEFQAIINSVSFYYYYYIQYTHSLYTTQYSTYKNKFNITIFLCKTGCKTGYTWRLVCVSTCCYQNWVELNRENLLILLYRVIIFYYLSVEFLSNISVVFFFHFKFIPIRIQFQEKLSLNIIHFF